MDKLSRTWLLGLLVLGFVNGAGAAEFYKWTDANGVVHYDNAAPKGVTAERKQVSSKAPEVVAPPASTTAADAAAAPVAPTAASENARRQAEYRKQRCAYAQKQLTEVQARSEPKVYERRGTEVRKTLLAERKAEAGKWQGEIGQYCGAG